MRIQDNPILVEKLTKLRQQYPGDYQLIMELETNLQNKMDSARVIDSPFIQGCVEEARNRVNNISQLLAFDEKLNEPTDEARIKRLALFHERNAHIFWMSALGIDIQKEIDNFINFADSKLDG